jgi:hypothetical protein
LEAPIGAANRYSTVLAYMALRRYSCFFLVNPRKEQMMTGNLKALGLTLVAAVALGAIMAQAASAWWNTVSAPAPTILCGQASLRVTELAAVDTNLPLHPASSSNAM